MENEVGTTHVFIGLVIIALVLLGLFFIDNKSFTGFAVFNEQPADIANGDYVDTAYDSGVSAVVLNSSANATSGTYTSTTIYINESVTWNNLTWQGNLSENSSLLFQVTTCSDENCSDANFTDVDSVNNTIDLSSLNLTGQYFQYSVLFSIDNLNISSPSLTGVAYSYSTQESEVVEQLTITILEPTGTQTTASGIPIEYTVFAENVNITNCQYRYNVEDTIYNNTAIANTTFTDCGNSSFDIPNEGSYIFNLYVNSSLGLSHEASPFSVDEGDSSASSEESASTEEESEESSATVSVIPTQPSLQLTANDLPTFSLNSGDAESVQWVVQNTGTGHISACSVSSIGDLASWVSYSADSFNINSGESGTFVFDLAVPEGTEEGEYIISLSLECAETSTSKDLVFDVTIVSEPSDEGTPTAGFAIFGGNGGTGGFIAFLIVVLSLVVVFVTVRRMRKTGTSFRDLLRYIRLRRD